MKLEPADLAAIADAVAERMKLSGVERSSPSTHVDELVTTDEIAARTKTSRQKWERLRREGGGPAYLQPEGTRHVRYRWSVVQAWLDKSSKTNTVRGQ